MSRFRDFKDYVVIDRMSNIENVVIVGSGKGGVGKSTITAMLALRLRDSGMSVGVLDADLHGNSIPYILGVDDYRIEVMRGGFKPAEVHGVKLMSLRFFVGREPVPLRGERKDEVVKYLLSFTIWDKLNYLLIDLPPGMGDELLTLIRYINGKHVVVTIPSRTSLDIVVKYLELLKRIGCNLSVMVVNNIFNVDFDEDLIKRYVCGDEVEWVLIPFIRDIETSLARGILPQEVLKSVDELISYLRL